MWNDVLYIIMFCKIWFFLFKILGIYIMVIILIEIVVNCVCIFFENCGKGIGLCLGVKILGCLGLVYVLEFVDVLNEDD